MESAKQRRTRMTENTRRYRQRHPERIKASRAQVYWKRKRRALDLIGGAICVSCGCEEIEFLEINHIGGGGCQEIRVIKRSLHDDLLSGKRSSSGLNVLCRVCNAIDFLRRKKPDAAGIFIVRWEKCMKLAQRAVAVKPAPIMGSA